MPASFPVRERILGLTIRGGRTQQLRGDEESRQKGIVDYRPPGATPSCDLIMGPDSPCQGERRLAPWVAA